DADRRPELDYLTTIHHGIDLDAFESHAVRGPYLVFLGRIHAEKGTAEAVRAARQAGRPLVIAGPIADQAYFDTQIRPLVDDVNVRYLGSIGPEQRRCVLGGAHALLHLISFEEPFGFSVVEALASGTPVVAFDRGSMRELVTPGVTGYLVDDVEQAAAAVAMIDRLDRSRVRAEARDRFGRDRMVDRYLDAYEAVLANRA
ncbi:MAG: glycosyltransferase, partial [Acidimicrobiales bacterium]